MTKPKGFAAMDRAALAALASKGGKAAHAKGTAHEFSTEEARLAGSKGGKAAGARKRAMAVGAIYASGAATTAPTPSDMPITSAAERTLPLVDGEGNPIVGHEIIEPITDIGT